jgi:hypothetical protein
MQQQVAQRGTGLFRSAWPFQEQRDALPFADRRQLV